MTAIALSPADESRAIALAREIGAAFARARRRNGDVQKHVAARIGIRANLLSRFECGDQKNLKLGNAVRMLGLYGLTLAVVPIDDTRSTP